MTESANRALLPAGLRDMLPPDAEFEASVVHSLMSMFARHGYDRVKPPLIEFEESLLDGAGGGTSSQTFRVMDPMSQKMMGLRADMTPQVARIAATRLGTQPRPLRLSYAGQVLRVKGTQLRPERQFGQAGIELIGSDEARADAEVLVMTAEALAEMGVPGVSADLALPTLVPAVFAAYGISGETAERLRAALDHKDSATVAALGGQAAPLLQALIAAAGPAARALSELAALDLPPAAARERDRLAQVVGLVAADLPSLTLTVDPVENRGFEYHTGLSFTLFARNMGAELGRGGRYQGGGGEPATGATLFMDSVLAALPGPKPARRLFVPAGTPRAWAQAFRVQGWVTVSGLVPAADSKIEAKRQGCGHCLGPDGIVEVE
ncbi:ATP phosphoribosyltransferase regulatory subunit [Paramagnetospirillum magnetotacticum MS-1]|uniref:ATP phosphoribosyltransferase regulatory subunit n=1 Tax=Paramagnetospirillum magnetotacticum MS-1 TaxID=272627 RepID=A0A0C2U6A9_PARME|nr:ATP phosphoribosyltransferase regulatory subunit [Paramagnetospirillum magnetotacticum]KIL96987.1 ATP phosphoribosyltransferase regulatory subunit [Paramagnetospirillum magnetotacticum MS-1]